MKNKYLTVLCAVVWLLCRQSLFAGETNDTTIADLTNLVAKINVKLEAGKRQEADFADNIKEFDVLLAKHKGAKPEDLAQILLAKAQLYADASLLDEPEKALDLFKRIKHDFPTVQINGNTDETISGLEPVVAQWKIWHSLTAGTKFSGFAATNIFGQALSTDDYKGKVVLVDFWATWCPPCRAALPDLLKTYSEYHSQGFEIIGVSLDDNLQKLLAFTRMMNMPWPQTCDGQGWTGGLVTQYGVYRLPSTVLFNGQGIIIGRDLRGDALEQAVAKAVARK
ncbi:MAG TPA: TlpA disulfide reductase family protein [Verrucomicrobiae bacterium]|nr:TlpA disulfide reductase family protein [Verrucomicrobiae bacterium]